jgi:L-iditol 2-dehydrogenase
LKAALLYGPKDLRIEDRPDPILRSGEILLRVRAVGVCGSDVHTYAHGRIGPTVLQSPLILGHEFGGQVVQVAEHVTHIRPGDRVAVDPARNCTICEPCRRGHPNLCTDLHFCGLWPDDGALVETMAYPARLAHIVPDTISFGETVLLETLGIAIHATDLARLRGASEVAVLGCGPVGLLVIQMARLSGATRIFATDLLHYRLEFARQCGATDVMNAAQGDPVAWISEQTRGRGVDVALEAAGAVETPAQAVEMARHGGTVCLIGIPVEDRTEFRASSARRKGLTIKLVRRMKHTYPRAITLAERGLVDLRLLLTHEFRLEDAEKAFQLVENYADGVLKAVIEFEEG